MKRERLITPEKAWQNKNREAILEEGRQLGKLMATDPLEQHKKRMLEFAQKRTAIGVGLFMAGQERS